MRVTHRRGLPSATGWPAVGDPEEAPPNPRMQPTSCQECLPVGARLLCTLWNINLCGRRHHACSWYTDPLDGCANIAPAGDQ